MITYKEFQIGIALLFIPAIYTGFFSGKIVIINALCLYLILFFFFKKSDNFKPTNEISNKGLIIFYVFISQVTLIRGLFDLKSQQDFIIFFSGTVFLMYLFPSFIYLPQSKYILKIFKVLFIVALPLSFVTYIIIPTDGFMTFQHNASFIFIFVFIIPFLNLKWKIIIFLIFLSIPLYDISRRSSVINFFICFLILISNFILPELILKIWFKFLFILFISAPIFLLILGLAGIFNVFTLGDNFKEITVNNKSNERNLLVDSRTGIYQDVFFELSKQNRVIFGLGANGKTSTFSNEVIYKSDKIYGEGRRNTESGMLNQFLFSGLIGALSYWLLLVVGSYNAIFKSKNKFIRMLGLFISFKVFYSFVEDQLIVNVETFYLMLMIGLCYNIKVRSLRDQDLKKMCTIYFK